jgi:hypothetical protein
MSAIREKFLEIDQSSRKVLGVVFGGTAFLSFVTFLHRLDHSGERERMVNSGIIIAAVGAAAIAYPEFSLLGDKSEQDLKAQKNRMANGGIAVTAGVLATSLGMFIMDGNNTKTAPNLIPGTATSVAVQVSSHGTQTIKDLTFKLERSGKTYDVNAHPGVPVTCSEPSEQRTISPDNSISSAFAHTSPELGIDVLNNIAWTSPDSNFNVDKVFKDDVLIGMPVNCKK